MAKTTKEIMEIFISRGATINMGNYESERVEVSLTKTIDSNDLEDEYSKLLSWVEGKRKQAVEGIVRKNKV
jgi:hypothetical protein